MLQAIHRCNELPLHTRMRAAMACLPFETPKLLATAIVDGQDFATLLDQRIARYQQMQLANNAKLIEAQPSTASQPRSRPSPKWNQSHHSRKHLIAGFDGSKRTGLGWFESRRCAILCEARGTYREVPVGESGALCIQCLGAPLTHPAVAGLIFGDGLF